MLRPAFLLGLAAGLALVTPLSAGDWPQFRGPTGQGHSADDRVPTDWSKPKNIVWKQEIPGKGWSSPIVVGGKVYLTTAAAIPDSADLSLRALCLDTKDGKVLWNKEVFRQDGKKAPHIHTKNSHASPTPIIEGDRLYVHFGHQGTACLDLSGEILWSNRTLAYQPVHGSGGSPVLVDGLLIFSADGLFVREVVALEAKSGKVKWRTSRSGAPFKRFSFSTPLVITVDGKKQVISPGSEMVGGYDLESGKEIWKVRHSGYSVIPRPVLGHGMLFLSSGYEAPELLAIKVGGKGDVTKTHVKWRLRKGAPHTPSPLLVGDELYAVSDHGLASCLDAKEGKVHWQKRVGGRGFSASPVHAGGHVYFLSEDGVCTVVKAGRTYEQVARNELAERTLASIAISDNSLFIRTEAHLYRIGP
jgi:outer membrane protein assembly factor BamB